MKGTEYEESIYREEANDEWDAIREIIKGLRDLPGEHLVVKLNDYPDQIKFVQTVRMDDKGQYLVEIGLKTEKPRPRDHAVDKCLGEGLSELFP